MKENDKDIYGHILKYTSLFGGVHGLNILITIVRTKIVTWLLGPGGMGLSSLFQTTANFISQATNLGISFSAVRNVSELFDSGDEARIAHFIKVVRAWSLLTGLIGTLLCMLIGPILSQLTFTWGDHTLHFVVLAPLVGMLAVTGGETAILKSARQLRSLAAIQMYNVIVALLISVPVYYFFGESGIVPVMLLTGLFAMILTIQKSHKLYPLRFSGIHGILGEGMGMVKLGVAFTLAGIFGSGADFITRAYLNNVSSLDEVGHYNVGYMMTMTYAGMIFSAMETDYFPRLSAVNNDRFKCMDLISKQAEVSLLLISPIIVAAIFLLPVALPLLTSSKFLPVVDMMRIMSLALYLRAVNLSLEYLSLAKGASLSYLFLEGVYDVLVVVLTIVCYQFYGLTGAGAALLAAGVFNTLLVMGYIGLKFGVHIRKAIFLLLLLQMGIGVAAFFATQWLSGFGYWLAGIGLFGISLWISVNILRRKTHLWDKIKAKINKILGK